MTQIPARERTGDSGIRSIAKNATYLTVARTATYLLRGVYVVILARYLGPEVYGLFAYTQSWYLAFIPLTGLGINIILSREVGCDHSRGLGVIGHTLLLRSSGALTVAFACGLAGWLIETMPAARVLLMIFSFALLGRALSVWAEEVFTAYEVSNNTFQQEGIFRPLEVIIGVIVLVAGGGATEVAVTHAVIWWSQAIRGFIVVHRNIVHVRLLSSARTLIKLLTQGFPIGLQTLFVVWLLQGPLVEYRHVAGAKADLGQLALVMQAFLILYMVPASVGDAAVPVLSRSIVRQDGKDQGFAQRMLLFGLLMGSAAGITGTAVGPWLVNMLFGSRYSQAGSLLGPAIWLLVPFSWGNATSIVLLARGHLLPVAICSLIGAVVLTIVLPSLATAFGALGALFAAGTGASVRAIGLIAFLSRVGNLELRRSLLWPGAGVFTAVSAFTALKPIGAWVALPASLVILFCTAVIFEQSGQGNRLLRGARTALSRKVEP